MAFKWPLDKHFSPVQRDFCKSFSLFFRCEGVFWIIKKIRNSAIWNIAFCTTRRLKFHFIIMNSLGNICRLLNQHLRSSSNSVVFQSLKMHYAILPDRQEPHFIITEIWFFGNNMGYIDRHSKRYLTIAFKYFLVAQISFEELIVRKLF